ncbi:MAG: DUF3307 domain-containing protein [Bacillota bacterium]
MFKIIFLYLLLIHILGDYYFQSDLLAKGKQEHLSQVKKHGMIYAGICVLAMIPVLSRGMILSGICLAVSHFVIDILKYHYIKKHFGKKKLSSEKERVIYLADQSLHLFFAGIIAYIFTINHGMIQLLMPFNTIFQTIGISAYNIFTWVLILLLIWKPANITIKQLLSQCKPDDENGENSKKTGGFIGLLERIVLLVFLSIGQYSAMGLVLTAKSIARYDKISKSQEFAEYYLLGTLLSTAIVLIAYLLIY